MNKDNKKFVVESLFIKNALKNALTLKEYLLLMYFDNAYECVFDTEMIMKYTHMKEEDILISFASLVEKKFIKVEVGKDSRNKVVEKINIDNFYTEIEKDTTKIKNANTEDNIYTTIESQFGRTLSQADFDIINAWLEKKFSEKIIIKALDEAKNNGINSLRYIDKLLFDWRKKGIVEPLDMELTSKNDSIAETSLLNFNWLDND